MERILIFRHSVWLLYVVVTIMISSARQYKGSEKKEKIVVAGLFPLSHKIPEGIIGKGVLPAVNLAVSRVNKNKHILPDYELKIKSQDTRCDMAVATKIFFDRLHSNITMAMVFGDACSTVSGPIAEISKEWNVSLLSYADTDPLLSDKKYNNFYRTVPCESDFNPARLALLRYFNWTNVGTIFQGVSKGKARYGHAHNHLVSLLEKSRVNVIKSVGFVNDPAPAIMELKAADVRIVIGNFDEKMARHVFCHAYKHGMFGPKYQWIILGGYDENWWRVPDSNITCSPMELNKTMNGYISTDILPLSRNTNKTISNWTPEEYFRQYMRKSKGNYSKFHAYAFDGVWVIAHVVDKLIKRAKYTTEMTSQISSEIFRGDNVSAALNETNFTGVTGQVLFDGGDRVGSILFEQFQGESMVRVAEYHKLDNVLVFDGYSPIVWRDHLASTNWIWTSLNPTDNPIPAREYRSQQDPFTIYSRTARLILDSYTNNTRQTRPLLDLHSEYQATNERRLDHQGKGPPIDRKLVRVEYLRVPMGVYLSICTVAGFGIIIATFFLGVNIVFRKHRYIKMSSPNMNNIIIVGCILTYLSVVLLGTDGGIVPVRYLGQICTSRAWVLSVGFTLAFGAMFSKTWRVHSIFTDIKLHKKVIRDYKLFLLVSVLLVIDAGILASWQILDPLQTAARNLTTELEGDLNIIPVLESCRSGRMTMWLGLIYVYKGLLLVFGCFLAWETRQVSIPALNDSKYIGMSVYNVVIMCVCGAAVSFVINDQPTSSFIIISFFIIFCTTITLCLVFVPKIIEIKRDPTGEERRIRAKLQKPKKQHSSEEDDHGDLYKKNEELVAENIKYRNIIAEKLRVLQSLAEQLGGDCLVDDGIKLIGKSPVHKKVIELRLADTSPSKLSSLSSDVEDESINSDISFDSTSWTVGKPVANKLHVQLRGAKSVTSTCTDVSFTGSTEDLGKRFNPRSSTIRHNYEPEDEEDSDAFGGVYCGPSDSPAVKLTSLCVENGRSSAIPESLPLINAASIKTYMSTTDGLHKSNFNDKSILNNINTAETNDTDDRDDQRHDTKKNCCNLGNKRKCRKLTFTCQSQDKVYDKVHGDNLLSTLTRTGQRTEEVPSKILSTVDEKDAHSPGIACDIIEHI